MAECGCPEIADEEWHGKEHYWSERRFYRVRQWNFLHMPLKWGRNLDRGMAEARAKGYTFPEQPLLLDDGAGFRGNILVELSEGNEGDPKVVTFRDAAVFSYVFKEPWRFMAKGMREMVAEMKTRGKGEPRRVYFWYATCPVCSAERGHRTVILGVS